MKKKVEDSFFISNCYRKIGNIIAEKLSFIAITPNQVTVLGLLTGILGCLLILTSNPFFFILSGICLQLNVIFDFADGSLAYRLSRETKLGKWLDVNAGLPVDTLMFLTMAVALYNKTGSNHVWLLSFLGLSWRYLIRNIYFSFQETGFFSSNIYASEKNIFIKIAREFIPTRYFVILLASISLIIDQTYGFLLVFSIYGGITYSGLLIVIYRIIAKSEAGLSSGNDFS